MKKLYNQPKLTTHGSVEAITQWSGRRDLNDWAIFNGTPANNPATGQAATGDGSMDVELRRKKDGGPRPLDQLQGKPPAR